MKKKLGLILIIAACVACAFGFAACDWFHEHEYQSEDILPTCTEQGYTMYLCECGDSYSENYIEALGHEYSEYLPDNNATCEHDGTKTATCARCGGADVQTDENTKLEHVLTTHELKEATCTQGGWNEYQTCENCTYSTKVDIDALGHQFDNYISNDNATCVKDSTKTATCGRCGETDTQTEEGTKLGHLFTTYVYDNNETCLKDGTETADCERCEEIDVKTVEGTKLGHSFTTYVYDNNETCLKDGTETADCERC